MADAGELDEDDDEDDDDDAVGGELADDTAAEVDSDDLMAEVERFLRDQGDAG